ncbi:FKBP-type peptidyl-prolyl cis-trans isomerase [Sphingobacterium sp. SRCM116780]|uniref:FKBP-type peptidyl-prolyl cis-trans isomerase n=1 Tax=Sphingobacterium sp. SRCM116780 TaxID=2907623 RepID=UPI001F39E23B|nr:FKBP-type peptidyl-prolyl cis-trans isomerase [Sphingobacterium sp. SRCM116780]UIR57733.1 FKBP-type peptidyl-prolyl cis-trans isomerase [Sphingobacterium sp. SRCM116780]
MKYIALAILSLATLSVSAQQKKKTVKKTTTVKTLLSTKADSVSYAFGRDIGGSLKSLGITNWNQELIGKALISALNDQNSLIEEDKLKGIIQQAVTEVKEQKEKENLAKEQAFFTENAKKPTVKSTPEGLQYEVLVAGTGDKPNPENEVTVHYTGTLLDGKKFDSSYDRNEPLKMKLDRVIEGWKIGVPLMSKGAKYRFYIPSRLGYGSRDMGAIPPNSILIFDIELVDFVKNAAE